MISNLNPIGRMLLATCASLILVAGCNSDNNSDSTTSTTDTTTEPLDYTALETQETIDSLAAAVPDGIPSVRGSRNCEVFDLGIEGDMLILNVWNNVGQGHECEDDWLAVVDPNQYVIDGPRWNPADYALALDDDLNFVVDETAITDEDSVVREIPEGSGVTMLLAAKNPIMSLAQLSATTGIEINTLEDIPQEMYSGLLSQLFTVEGNYSISEVGRQVKTFWVFEAGNPVYVLSDGECDYAMKYYTATVNDTLTDEGAVADLANQFEALPEGYSYEVRYYAEDMHLLDIDGLQYVIADEFGNTYDRLSCGENSTAYTIP